MFKTSFLLVYITLTIVILLTTLATSIIRFPFSVLVQLVSIMTIMIIFFLIMRKRLKPSLKIFQATIKKVAKNDPSLDDADIHTINSISDSTFFNLKKLIKYSNLLLINQNTILEAAHSDRDYINKNRKLQDRMARPGCRCIDKFSSRCLK